jgi:hypothetical protein
MKGMFPCIAFLLVLGGCQEEDLYVFHKLLLIHFNRLYASKIHLFKSMFIKKNHFYVTLFLYW